MAKNEKDPRPPSGGRLRSALRAISLPKALPGWSVLLVMGLDSLQRIQFVSALFGTSFVEFLRTWGWLIGLGWLAGVIYWTATKPEPPGEAERVRRMERLRRTIDDAIQNFENMCVSYEVTISQAQADKVALRRCDLMFAMARVIEAALATVPERRAEYERLLRYVLLDRSEFRDFTVPQSIFVNDTSPTYAIEQALGMHRLKPQEDPPASTEPSQSLPSSPESSESPSASK